MNQLLRLALLAVLMFSISSCNSRGGAPLCTTCEPAGLADEAGGRDSSSSTTGVSTSNPLPAGTLTAGVWDDNLNFEFFSSYLSTVTLGGVPTFSRNDRVVFRLHSASGAPLVGAHVEISQTGSRLVAVDSAADGTVVFLPSFMGATDQAPLDVTVTAVGGAQTHKQVPPTAAMYEVTVDQAPDQAETGIDIAIVLDTTGSMGDEIGYLQSEVDSIATDVSNRFANLPQRWALVLYRDEGDDYLTQVTDFTSLEAFKTALGTATATGGGDTPEAVDEALSQVPKLSWRTGAVTRLAFHVADAPHHAEKTARVEASLRDIISHSVRYYPIASSGVDEVFEQTFRGLAQATGGRYLFLTNDSGVGSSHKEPTLPCYQVTKLHEAMVRVISMEISGAHEQPPADQVIRTVGSPADGRCTLESGSVVSLY